MTNGIGLRRLIKFGDVGAYIYNIYVTESGEAEGQTKEYIHKYYIFPRYNISYIIITTAVIFSSFTSLD